MQAGIMDVIDDHSIYILLSLKNAKNAILFSTGGCQLSKCLICCKGVPLLLQHSPTWPNIMRVVLHILKYDQPQNDYFNLRTDIYPYMDVHWDMLCLNKAFNNNWKKQVQDVLSHYKAYFENGSGVFKQNGFWKLKDYDFNPWAGEWSKNKVFTNPVKRPADLSLYGEAPHVVPLKKRRTMTNFEESIVPTWNNEGVLSEFQDLKTEIGLVKECMTSMKTDLQLKTEAFMHSQTIVPSSPQIHLHSMDICVPDVESSPPSFCLSPTSGIEMDVTQVGPFVDMFMTSNLLSPLQVVPQVQSMQCST